MRPPSSALVLAALALAACGGGSAGPLAAPDGWRVVVGAIAPSFSSVQAARAPLEARAGIPFDVTVTTLGSGSCTRPAGGRVTRVTARVVVVEPLDHVPSDAGAACTRDLASFPRAIAVTFTEPGDAVVRVRGRAYVAGEPGTIDLPVRVAP